MQTIPQQLQQKADSGRFCKSWDLDHPFPREVRAAGARPCCKAWVVQRVLSLRAWEETRPWLELLSLLTSQQATVAANGTSQHLQPGCTLWIHPNLEQGCCEALTQPIFLSENVSRKRKIIIICLLANFHPHVQDSTSYCSLEPPALGCALPAHKRGLSQWTKNDLEQHRAPCKLLRSPKRGARSQPLIAQAPHEKHLSCAAQHRGVEPHPAPWSQPAPPPALHSQRHSLPSAHGINPECCSYYLWVLLCSGEGCIRPGLEGDRKKGGEL